MKHLSVLLLEGDVRDQRTGERADIAGPVSAVLGGINGLARLADANVLVQFRHVRVWSEQSLTDQIPKHLEASRPDVVVLAGHSNRRVIRLLEAGDGTPWPLVATWLKPLRARRLVLVACEAGDWLPCRALFGDIPSLRVVLGSPMKVNVTQSAVGLLVPALLPGMPEGFLVAIQVVTFWHTNGVMLCRTRAEFEANPTDKVVGMVRDEVIKAIARDRAADLPRR